MSHGQIHLDMLFFHTVMGQVLTLNSGPCGTALFQIIFECWFSLAWSPWLSGSRHKHWPLSYSLLELCTIYIHLPRPNLSSFSLVSVLHKFTISAIMIKHWALLLKMVVKMMFLVSVEEYTEEVTNHYRWFRLVSSCVFFTEVTSAGLWLSESFCRHQPIYSAEALSWLFRR